MDETTTTRKTCEAKLKQTLYATATGWPSTEWLRCGQVVGVRPVAGGFACSTPSHVEKVIWQHAGDSK